MIEDMSQDAPVVQGEGCVIGGHGFTSWPPHRPSVRVDGYAMCEFHYNQINAHGIEQVRAKRPNQVLMDEARRRHKRVEAEESRADEVRKARRNQPGFVYYIRMDDLIKIGYASDVARRMRAYPPSAELLAVHPGTQQLEREIHAEFSAFLKRGREWFSPHEKVMEKVAEIRMRFGDPARFAYEYRQARG